MPLRADTAPAHVNAGTRHSTGAGHSSQPSSSVRRRGDSENFPQHLQTVTHLVEGDDVNVDQAVAVPQERCRLGGVQRPCCAYDDGTAHYHCVEWLDDLADHNASKHMPMESGAYVLADLILSG